MKRERDQRKKREKKGRPLDQLPYRRDVPRRSV